MSGALAGGASLAAGATLSASGRLHGSITGQAGSAIIASGNLSLGDSTSYTVLTWDGSLSGTASLSVDPAFAADGITLIPEWNSIGPVLEAVPEPSTLALFAFAAIAVAGYARRRHASSGIARNS